MLKYRINKDNVITDEDKVHISAMDVVYGVDNEQHLTKCTAICRMDNMDGKVTQGTKLVAYHNVAVTFEEYGKTVYPQTGSYVVSEVNNSEASFSFDFDKYVELPLISASKATIYRDGADGKDYLYMYFYSPHFFCLDDTKDNNVWLSYGGKFKKMTGFEVLTNTSIRFEWGIVEMKYGFINEVMRVNGVVDPTVARVFRKNYVFTSIDKYELYYGNPKCKITLGLTNMSQIDLLKEQKLVDYVKDAKRRSINGIVDYEKDIYYPVAPPKNGVYEPIWKIKFNLHFREHRGDDWTVEPDTYWNGTYMAMNKEGKTDLKFIEEPVKEGVPQSYFPMFEGKEEYQSDLLTYLGFTDSDVRFQKSRLKKSFLRLSFFDSIDPSEQNLLAYSTIFMNSGDYFNKYVRFLEEKPYLRINYDENGKYVPEDKAVNEETEQKPPVEGKLKGIRVDREPYVVGTNEEEMKKKANIEEYRMGSQFVVTDKYNSTASSEGFYLYLFRDLLSGLDEDGLKEGLDIYMKAEFNHAGYGRTIPLIMPFWDLKKTGRSGIKTFQEILDDWNKKSGTDGEYGIRQHEKFSYIHFKITYDETQRKYIYYLDKDCYGESAVLASNDNEITLNLYEAKMV